MTDFHVSFM